jgi:hypothetical protein
MPEIDQLELRARIGRILNRWPTVGMALGVVRNGRLEFSTNTGSPTLRRTHLSPRTRSSGSAPAPRPSRPSP